MKEYIYNTKIIGLLSGLIMMLGTSCNDDTFRTYEQSSTTVVITDAAIQVSTPVVAFQAGIASYEMSFIVINGDDVQRVSSIELTGVFTDAATGDQSDSYLFGSYPITADDREVVTINVTYDDLRNGVTVGGAALPTTDDGLPTGSGWAFTFSGTNGSGDNVPLSGSINVAVLSPFAGIYTVTAMEYYRIGVFRNDVTDPVIGDSRFLGSISETVFAHNDWIGPFQVAGTFWSFELNLTDNTVTAPLEGVYPGGFGSFTTNCTDNAGDLSNIDCAGGNVLIPNFTTGAHRFILAYGYFTNGSGPREFYEILDKVPN